MLSNLPQRCSAFALLSHHCGMLCNNSGPGACDVNSYYNSTLKWNGKQLTIDMKSLRNGKKMLWHEVWSNITAASFTQTGDIGEVGGPLKRAVTIHGTKVGEARKDSGKKRCFRDV